MECTSVTVHSLIHVTEKPLKADVLFKLRLTSYVMKKR